MALPAAIGAIGLSGIIVAALRMAATYVVVEVLFSLGMIIAVYTGVGFLMDTLNGMISSWLADAESMAGVYQNGWRLVRVLRLDQAVKIVAAGMTAGFFIQGLRSNRITRWILGGG